MVINLSCLDGTIPVPTDKVHSRSPMEKHQAPTSKHQRSINDQAPIFHARVSLGVWILKFLWCLELGIWSLFYSQRIKPSRIRPITRSMNLITKYISRAILLLVTLPLAAADAEKFFPVMPWNSVPNDRAVINKIMECGFTVASCGRLQNVTNIYDETSQRAYLLGRQVDCAHAQAVFLSGVGMPTLDVLDSLERDIGKPVISSASAMMWNALRVAGVIEPIRGFGRLLATGQDCPGPAVA